MQNQNETRNEIQKEIQRLKKQFLHSTDFTAKEIGWGQGEKAILCFYSSLVKKSEVERYVHLLRLEHKKALRAEENKKNNSNSQQKSYKEYNLNINSYSKYNYQKMRDTSKNVHQENSDIESQTNMQKYANSQSSDKQENGNESQQEKQKKSDCINSQESGQKKNQIETQNERNQLQNNDKQISKASSENQKEQQKKNTNGQEGSNVNQTDIEKILNYQKNNVNHDIETILKYQKNSANRVDNSNNNNQSANKNRNINQDNNQNVNSVNEQNKNNQESLNANGANASNEQEGNSLSSHLEDSMTITTEPYELQKIVDYICNGETIIILPKMQEIIRINSPEFPHRSPDEPENEQILRGAHEGFVEHIDSNISLIRKRIRNNKLIVKKAQIGKETKIEAYYVYLEDVVDKEALKTVEERLQSMNLDMYYTVGQLIDQLDDHVWSPFPQLLNTERPDRVAANIVEGKIAILTDISPTAIIGPVTFFTFYQSPDDFNSRVIIGTFYRLMRMISLVAAIFLPALYIAIVSFHFEVIPIELAFKVKMDINQIPYRPFIEALIMEITIELIREASVRLPKSIGQTIGIVGGLVIGESIVSAGLVSNLMVIVVAFTAISSFVVPSIELNTAIRVLRFPFMILAAMFGFFGILIGTFILVIHLLNLSSFKQPYFSPFIPFRPKELKKILFRDPYYKAHKQVTSFSPKKDELS